MYSNAGLEDEKARSDTQGIARNRRNGSDRRDLVEICPTGARRNKGALPYQLVRRVTQGGFYQALASGLYEKESLDVEIKMGGPQINGVQLLVAGEADFLMGNDFPCSVGVEKGLPIIAIAGTYQFALNGITTHPMSKPSRTSRPRRS